MKTPIYFPSILNYEKIQDDICLAYKNSICSFRDSLLMLLSLEYNIVFSPEFNNISNTLYPRRPSGYQFVLSTGEEFGCAKLNCFISVTGKISFTVLRRIDYPDIRPTWTTFLASKDVKIGKKDEFLPMEVFISLIPKIAKTMKKTLKPNN